MSFITDPVTFLANWLQGVLTGWGVSGDWLNFLMILIGVVVLALLALFWTIFLIWVERKGIGRFQERPGPNRVGPFGLIQPFADMLKIFTKELITPKGADWVPYNLAPVLIVASTIMVWAVLPFNPTTYGTNISIGILFVVAVGSLGEMGIILGGWGSNNKYALLGSFRVMAQLISYEIPMVVVLLIPVMLSGSMALNDIVKSQSIWNILLAPVAALIYFISLIAENARAPFDLAEADSEIVAGVNIEYSGLKFGFFYVGDFLHAFTMALLFATVFLGGWQGPYAEQYPILGFVYYFIKTWAVYFVNLWMRFSLPRFRIDQMMAFNWKILTPLALVTLMFTALLDKVLPVDQPVIRIVGFLVLNAILLVGCTTLIQKFRARRERPVVAPTPRPVARR